MAGFAVREIQVSTQIQTGLTPPGLIKEDAVNYFASGSSGEIQYSVESTVLSDIDQPDRTFIAVTYYYGPFAGGGKYILHLYEWDSSTGLTDMGKTTLNDLLGPANKGIIHQDANGGEIAVITFEQDYQIYSQTLRIVAGVPKLSGLSRLDNPNIAGARMKPDVAISNEGDISTASLYYVMTSGDDEHLYVLENKVYNLDGVSYGTIAVLNCNLTDEAEVWDVLSFTPVGNIKFDIPRIGQMVWAEPGAG
ncbi:MAG TPA: hypothetical protein PKX92_04445 [Edaphocola sp.]|nr:hypothetical protein [Edaphocola sp.]